MKDKSYHTTADLTFALTLDTAVMDMSVDCRYVFHPAFRMDEHSPVEPEHVELYAVLLPISKGPNRQIVNIMEVIREDDSMINAIEATLLEIELNNQE